MTLKNAAYKEDLDLGKCDCGRPSCEDPMFIHSDCHRGQPYFASYFDGVVTINCSVCDKEIVRIAVASRKNEQ